MKLTFEIDEALLNRVGDIFESFPKPKIINFALKKIDRKALLAGVIREGFGVTQTVY